MLPKRYRQNTYPKAQGCVDRIVEIKDKGNGKFLIEIFNDFVTIKTVNLTVLPSGKSHAKVRIEKNYHPTETVQYWYDHEGEEIICSTESEERKLFNKLL